MNIKMNYVGISTFVLTIDDKFRIGVDPALKNKEETKKRLVDPVYNEDTFKNINLWLVTHSHVEHLDQKGIDVIEKDTPFYAPSIVKDIALKNELNYTQMYLGVPKSIEFEDYNIVIQPMPAFKATGLIGKMIKQGMGYRITILKDDEEYNIYITGNIVLTDELITMFTNNCKGGANVFIPFLGATKYFNKRVTLNIKETREIAKYIHAKNTIAIHIDDCTHYNSDREEVKKYFNAPLPGEEINLEV